MRACSVFFILRDPVSYGNNTVGHTKMSRRFLKVTRTILRTAEKGVHNGKRHWNVF